MLKRSVVFVFILLLLCGVGLLGYWTLQQLTPHKGELFTRDEIDAARLYHRKCLRQGGTVIVSDYKYGIEITCIGSNR